MAVDNQDPPNTDNGDDFSIDDILGINRDDSDDGPTVDRSSVGATITIPEDDERFPKDFRGKTFGLDEAAKLFDSYGNLRKQFTKVTQDYSDVAKRIEGRGEDKKPTQPQSKPETQQDYLARIKAELEINKIDDPVKKEFFRKHFDGVKQFLSILPDETKASDNSITAALNYVAGEQIDDFRDMWAEAMKPAEDEDKVEDVGARPTSPNVRTKVTGVRGSDVENRQKSPSYVKEMSDARKSNLNAWTDGDEDAIKGLIGG